MRGGYAGTVTLDLSKGVDTRRSYGRKHEEFMADFCLVSKRVLREPDYKIFRYHFLLGADWKLCCRQLGMDRGLFFHTIYRIESQLGRAFAEMEPYPLWPVSEYFGPPIAMPRVMEPPKKERRRLPRPVRPRVLLPLSA